MSKSITQNFLFSSILTVSNYLFPFLVFPYVARVLGVDNVGVVNFVDSIINYAMLLSLMGVTIIGTRTIAKAKKNPTKLNEAFTALFLLTTAFTVLATAVLITITYTVDDLIPYRKLLLIGLVKLWGNFLLIEWLYKGLEDFRYITLRTIAVKMVFVVCVFVFIHAAGDYVVYFLLLCLMVAANAAFNCIRALKLVKLRYNFGYIRGCFGSFIILGVYLLLTSMYTTFNVTYLGFECGDVEVGYYTTATKIFKIVLALYAAYTTVVLPRASALLSEGKNEEFKRLIHLSIQGLTLFAIPCALFFMIFSPGVVYLIAGGQYGGAILPMVIVMPLMFIIGYEQIMVVQILTPMANDRVILFNSKVGAIVGVLANCFLVSRFQAVGSALAWLIAEVAVLIAAQRFVTKFTGLKFPWRELLKNLLAYVPFAGTAWTLAHTVHLEPIPMMLMGAGYTALYFFFTQALYLHNPVFDMTLQKFKFDQLINPKK